MYLSSRNSLLTVEKSLHLNQKDDDLLIYLLNKLFVIQVQLFLSVLFYQSNDIY